MGSREWKGKLAEASVHESLSVSDISPLGIGRQAVFLTVTNTPRLHGTSGPTMPALAGGSRELWSIFLGVWYHGSRAMGVEQR